MSNQDRLVVVFGGTGFLGRRVVQQLHAHEFKVRIASRRPPRVASGVDFVAADIDDEHSVAQAMAGAYGVVNAVSLYVERGRHTFHSVHVEAAQRVARQAGRSAVTHLVHVSGLGASPYASSLYIRKRGEGELAVNEAFSAATLIRPAVMFGPDDTFISRILNILSKSPVFPLFGAGDRHVQPAYVEDVAAAVARLIEDDDTRGRTFEYGGPRVYSYRELIDTLAAMLRKQRWTLPVPFAAWHAAATVAEFLPGAPLTRNQIELSEIDNVVSGRYPGFAELGIRPRTIEEIVPRLLHGTV